VLRQVAKRGSALRAELAESFLRTANSVRALAEKRRVAAAMAANDSVRHLSSNAEYHAELPLVALGAIGLARALQIPPDQGGVELSDDFNAQEFAKTLLQQHPSKFWARQVRNVGSERAAERMEEFCSIGDAAFSADAVTIHARHFFVVSICNAGAELRPMPIGLVGDFDGNAAGYHDAFIEAVVRANPLRIGGFSVDNLFVQKQQLDEHGAQPFWDGCVFSSSCQGQCSLSLCRCFHSFSYDESYSFNFLFDRM
jgi:hypothetical protein